MLLKWCAEKVTEKNFATKLSSQKSIQNTETPLLKDITKRNSKSLQKGIQNTEAPPLKVPIHLPNWHQTHLDYEILVIDDRKQRFLVRPYNNSQLTFIPPSVIAYALHQFLHDPLQNHNNNNNAVVMEVVTIHYIDGCGHINTLPEQ